MLDADTLVDFDVWDIPDDWEALADAGRDLADANDRNRWVLGDLALRVETRYGEDAIGQYASEIKVFERTLRTYRQVSAFYENGTRVQYPALSWSHYRMAVRLKDVDAAMALLAEAQDNNWSSRDLTDALNLSLGKPPVRRALLIETFTYEGGLFTPTLDDPDTLLIEGQRYEVTVKLALEGNGT